jgi:hypothetical protein
VTTCISAVQHLLRLRGGSQSHLLRASDGMTSKGASAAKDRLLTMAPLECRSSGKKARELA